MDIAIGIVIGIAVALTGVDYMRTRRMAHSWNAAARSGELAKIIAQQLQAQQAAKAPQGAQP